MIPHARDTEMRQHIQSWQASGETQTSYCKRHGIAEHQMIYYKRKLGLMKSVKSKSSTNQLVPVTIKPDDLSSQPIWIEHYNGFKVQFSSAICTEQLTQALTVIKNIS